MKRRLEFSARALRDLEAIGDYIARDNPIRARSWLRGLLRRARNTRSTPFAGRRVPEYGRDEIREVIEGNYRIGYRVTEERLIIMFICEGHRQLGPLED